MNIAEEAVDAWNQERDFDQQHEFMDKVNDKDEYIRQLESFDAYELAEWVEKNW